MPHEHDFCMVAVGTLYSGDGVYQRYIDDAGCECGETRPITHNEQLTMIAEAKIQHEQQARGNDV